MDGTETSPDLQTEEELLREDRATRERVARFAAAADKIDNSEVTESSPRGEVRVTVTTSGAVRHIDLAPSGARLPAGEIVPMVQACVQRAQARIVEVAQRILAEELGTDPTADLVLGDYRGRFPAADYGTPTPRPARTTDDETEQQVLRSAWSNDGGWA